MGLFSDVDWVIIAAVAAFLLFGRGNAEVLRTLGRWYGRAMNLKAELLSEVSKAADLPVATMGAGGIRATLLGLDPATERASRIPVAVTSPPVGAVAVPWTNGADGSLAFRWSVTGGPPFGPEVGP